MSMEELDKKTMVWFSGKRRTAKTNAKKTKRPPEAMARAASNDGASINVAPRPKKKSRKSKEAVPTKKATPDADLDADYNNDFADSSINVAPRPKKKSRKSKEASV